MMIFTGALASVFASVVSLTDDIYSQSWNDLDSQSHVIDSKLICSELLDGNFSQEGVSEGVVDSAFQQAIDRFDDYSIDVPRNRGQAITADRLLVVSVDRRMRQYEALSASIEPSSCDLHLSEFTGDLGGQQFLRSVNVESASCELPSVPRARSHQTNNPYGRVVTISNPRDFLLIYRDHDSGCRMVLPTFPYRISWSDLLSTEYYSGLDSAAR